MEYYFLEGTSPAGGMLNLQHTALLPTSLCHSYRREGTQEKNETDAGKMPKVREQQNGYTTGARGV